MRKGGVKNMAKKWYLIKATEKPFYVNKKIYEKMDYYRNMGEYNGTPLYEWFSTGAKTLDDTVFKGTYYRHEIINYQDWELSEKVKQLLPKEGYFKASKGLSFIIKDGGRIGVFYPHPFNFKPFKTRELKSYIAKISEHLFGDIENLKLIQYDIPTLNIRYPEKQRSLSFSGRKGGVRSGTLYGESMAGDTIYVEAKKGIQTYSVYIFEIHNTEYRIGVSREGSIVTFNDISNKEMNLLMEIYRYLKVGEKLD